MAKISSVTSQQLMELIKSGSVLVIDVRTVEEFTEDHIWGAQNHPIDKIPDSLITIPKDAHLVTVCNMGHGRSEEAGEKLFSHGWSNVQWLERGHMGWIEAGFSDYEAGTATS